MIRSKMSLMVITAVSALTFAAPAHAFWDTNTAIAFVQINSGGGGGADPMATQEVADAIRESGGRIANAITQASPEFNLEPTDIEHLKQTYKLAQWQDKIGIYVDGADAIKFAHKFGKGTYQQLIENRIKDFNINEVIAANYSRALKGQKPVTSLAEAQSELASSKTLNAVGLMRVIEISRHQPSALITAKDLDDVAIKKGASPQENLDLARMIGAVTAKSLQAGGDADFHRLTAFNYDQPDLFASASHWHEAMSQVASNAGQGSRGTLLSVQDANYCQNGFQKDFNRYKEAVGDRNRVVDLPPYQKGEGVLFIHLRAAAAKVNTQEDYDTYEDNAKSYVNSLWARCKQSNADVASTASRAGDEFASLRTEMAADASAPSDLDQQIAAATAHLKELEAQREGNVQLFNGAPSKQLAESGSSATDVAPATANQGEVQPQPKQN